MRINKEKIDLFSIILPSFNRAKFLPRVISSISQQTIENWELIIVDDGSTDDTELIVHNLAKDEPRIRYVYQENLERSAARNHGIKEARGDYICFIDSDDFFREDHLESFQELIAEKSFENAVYVSHYSVLRNESTEEVDVCTLTKESDIKCFLVGNPIIPSRVCVSREILEEFNFDEDITIVEDTILWLRISEKYPFHQHNKATIKYHLHDDNSINIMSKGSEIRLAGLKTFFKRYPLLIKSKKLKTEMMGDAYFNVATHYIAHKKKVKSLKYLLLSLFRDPSSLQTKHKLYCIFKLISFQKIEQYNY
ncbi:MAG: glycosyltransferase family A protein [Nitrososphaeraceae archaeon]|nr:glycosyltransferase family A protein [Nitrososphaeraceae archaeon]